MTVLFAAILGIVQGLTEFLPVSSSAHLILAHDALRFDLADDLSFDVSLHTGTLLALLAAFWRPLWRYLRAFLRSLRRPAFASDVDQRVAWFLLVGSVPAAVVGLLLEDAAETVLRKPGLIAVTLAIGGVLFLLVERFRRREGAIERLSFLRLLVVGLGQSLAIIPGISRSGVTIIAGMSQGLSRSEATKLSFLLAAPIIAGAGLKRLGTFVGAGFGSNELIVFAVGTFAATIVGYAAIRFLLRYVQGHTLAAFAYYRFVLAAVVFAAIIAGAL